MSVARGSLYYHDRCHLLESGSIDDCYYENPSSIPKELQDQNQGSPSKKGDNAWCPNKKGIPKRFGMPHNRANFRPKKGAQLWRRLPTLFTAKNIESFIKLFSSFKTFGNAFVATFKYGNIKALKCCYNCCRTCEDGHALSVHYQLITGNVWQWRKIRVC